MCPDQLWNIALLPLYVETGRYFGVDEMDRLSPFTVCGLNEIENMCFILSFVL